MSKQRPDLVSWCFCRTFGALLAEAQGCFLPRFCIQQSELPVVAVHTGHVQQILHTLFVEATLAAIKNRQGKTRQRENTRRPKKKEEQRPGFLKEIGKFNH